MTILKKVNIFIIEILCLISLIDFGTGLFELYGISEAETATVIRYRKRKIPIQLGVILSITGLASCEGLCGMHMISTKNTFNMFNLIYIISEIKFL